MMTAKAVTERRYLIYLCPRCKNRTWDKGVAKNKYLKGERVGWCKASGKPVSLIDDGESLTKSEPCIWFELEKKRR